MAPKKSPPNRDCSEIGEVELQNLSLAVLEHAARDAKKGDPVAAAWFLSADAQLYGEGADLEHDTLGNIAYQLLEVLYYGK